MALFPGSLSPLKREEPGSFYHMRDVKGTSGRLSQDPCMFKHKHFYCLSRLLESSVKVLLSFSSLQSTTDSCP